MNELLVLGLVSAVLSGTTGEIMEATVLAYTPVEQTITVDGTEVLLQANKTTSIQVPLRLEHGFHQVNISITSDTTTYHLPVSTTGKRDLKWLWWLTAIPVVGLLLAVRIRKKDVGNS